jgi:GntR family transcriptional regulator/MocR family aminotransferase
VVVAFEQLHAEGYVETERGVGSRVSLEIPSFVPRKSMARDLNTRGVSKRARRSLDGATPLFLGQSLGRAFRSYEPAIDQFPVELWAKVAARVLRRAPRSLYGQGDPGGYMPLRKAIAEYVGSSRGVRCTARQVIVTAGTQQALDLLCRLLLDDGDEAWIEDPGYPGALQAMRAAGVKPIPVPVDDEGLVVEQGIKRARNAQLVYVTPSNQFPLGVTMSAVRRMELIRWAAANRAWIIEDEYDAEYRYSGRPVASLHSLDQSGSVLYVGTFTKMLFNALRLGFVVVPQHLI